MDKKRCIYIDFIKTVAIISVLAIHASAPGFTSYDFKNINYIVSVLYGSLVRFAVPVFIMSSGAIFLNEEKEITIKNIYKKYIPRIIAALLLFALFYESVPLIFTYIKTGIIDKGLFKNGITNLFTLNTHFHLYYLYIIVILYALTPVLKSFLKGADKKREEYLIVFLFIFSSLVPFLRNLFSLNNFGGMTTQYDINLTYGMLLYFLLGHYFSKYDVKEKVYKLIIFGGILGFIITFFGTIIMSQVKNYSCQLFLEGMYPNIFLMAVAIFNFSKYHNFKHEKIYVNISKSSFLIYLIHDFYNIVFRSIGLSIDIIPAVFSIPLLVIINFVLSYITYLIAKRIPLLNKII